jgi:tetratricopeptide (TPR) repeat protein
MLELKFPTLIGRQLANRAEVHALAEDWPECLQDARECLRIAVCAQESLIACLGAMFAWWAAVRMGDQAAAEDARGHYASLHARLGGTTVEEWARIIDIEVALASRGAEDAVSLARRAVQQSRESGSVIGEALALRTLARALCQLQRYDEAEHSLEESLRVSDAAGALLLSARTHVAWADVRRARGDARGADQHTELASRLVT